MDPFLSLLHAFSSSLSDTELSSLKFLCRDRISKRKLESVRSGRELFTILLEQQDIARDKVDFLEELLKGIKRKDLVAQLNQFVEEGGINTSDDQLDEHEKRCQKVAIEVICNNVGKHWRRLMRKLDLSEVQLDRVVEAHRGDLREQLVQALREWQRSKGKDAKVTDLIKALRACEMNLVADKVEQELLGLNTGTR
ncbi:PREDICTED: FAS-associated death domain protein [Merops nubicus]|uniref:FAS-associated death domain protein n=1 Tax=Merops nubicus TaxID=57421 RepID=UPI0004F02395|nr:PREDICTED: FAS-associated death domain protein [Merops nubicus]